MSKEKNIHIDKAGKVDHDKQKVEKGEEAVWHSDTDQKYTIEFTTEKGSPFKEPKFDVSPGIPAHSGEVKPEADGDYDYVVNGKDGMTDPTIIIQR